MSAILGNAANPVPSMWQLAIHGAAMKPPAPQVQVPLCEPKKKETRGRRGSELRGQIEKKLVEVVTASPGIKSGPAVAAVLKAFPETKLSRVHVIFTELCARGESIRREGERGSYTHQPLSC